MPCHLNDNVVSHLMMSYVWWGYHYFIQGFMWTLRSIMKTHSVYVLSKKLQSLVIKMGVTTSAPFSQWSYYMFQGLGCAFGAGFILWCMFQVIWGRFHCPVTCPRISRIGFIPDPCFRTSGVCFTLLRLCNQVFLDLQNSGLVYYVL